jgi:hypothetical protein
VSTITLFSRSFRILPPGDNLVTELNRKATLANLATFTLGQITSCQCSSTSLLRGLQEIQLLFYSIDGKDDLSEEPLRRVYDTKKF